MHPCQSSASQVTFRSSPSSLHQSRLPLVIKFTLATPQHALCIAWTFDMLKEVCGISKLKTFRRGQACKFYACWWCGDSHWGLRNPKDASETTVQLLIVSFLYCACLYTDHEAKHNCKYKTVYIICHNDLHYLCYLHHRSNLISSILPNLSILRWIPGFS